MNIAINDKVVMSAFIALLVISSVTAYLLVFDEVNGDPRQDPHEYIFDGVLLEEPCTGTGQTTFVERSGGCALYSLSFSVSSPSSSLDRSMDLIFDENGRLDDSFICIGDTFVNDCAATIWKTSNGEANYMLYTGNDCRLLRIEITSTEFDLTGCIQ